MPLSAAATGVVDHAHPPRDLARVLCGLSPREPEPHEAVLSDDPSMDAVLRLLRDHFGIDFSLYKTTSAASTCCASRPCRATSTCCASIRRSSTRCTRIC